MLNLNDNPNKYDSVEKDDHNYAKPLSQAKKDVWVVSLKPKNIAKTNFLLQAHLPNAHLLVMWIITKDVSAIN